MPCTGRLVLTEPSLGRREGDDKTTLTLPRKISNDEQYAHMRANLLAKRGSGHMLINEV